MISFGRYESPFGPCVIVKSGLEVVGLGFLRSPHETSIAIFRELFPRATAAEEVCVEEEGALIFREKKYPDLQLTGTPFQKKVWERLRQIPEGQTLSYAQLAAEIGQPRATRAAASAVARNPISYVIPCHRVIRSDGSIHRYRWGHELKVRLLMAESAQSKSSSLPSDLSSFLN